MRISDWSSDVCSSDLQFSISRRKLQIVAKRLVDRNLLIRQPDNAFLASERGRQTFERIVAGYRDWLALVLDRWSPESHADVRAMLNRFARQLVADLPASPARQGSTKASYWIFPGLNEGAAARKSVGSGKSGSGRV